MKKNSQIRVYRGIAIALISFCVLMVGFKLAVTSAISFGGDFFNFWQAGRALILRGVSPYDPSTTASIQQGIYGRLAKPSEDQLKYVYPPFALLVILPSVSMTYAWAQAYWMAFNLVSIFIALLVIKKRPPLWLLASLLFFYPVSRTVILGPFDLVLGASLIIAYGLLNNGKLPSPSKQWFVGILLAWCAMKPQLSGLIILFVLLGAVQKKEWRVFAGLVTGAIFFAGISWIFVPTWVSDWIKVIFDYVGYVPIQPILKTWLATLGLDWSALWLKLCLLAAGVGLSGWILTAWWKKQLPDFLALGWLVLVSQLVNPNPKSQLSDQIIFFLPLVLWLTNPSVKIWLRKIIWAAFVIVPWVLFGLYFQGKEPYEVASGLGLLFTLWLAGMLITHFRNKKYDLENKQPVEVNSL
jgi:hypothetical protein